MDSSRFIKISRGKLDHSFYMRKKIQNNISDIFMIVILIIVVIAVIIIIGITFINNLSIDYQSMDGVQS